MSIQISFISLHTPKKHTMDKLIELKTKIEDELINITFEKSYVSSEDFKIIEAKEFAYVHFCVVIKQKTYVS